ncbi:MAG: hypothetical protein LBJ84_01160, partial [Oscillospiraceae bacterium]|nr:hypothetical protein [Oscillospiraceae bacterium]
MSTGAISASPDALWWDTISGPSRFIREITSALRGGKHVCLFSRGGLPWHTAFLNRVREALLEAERDIQFIDDLEYGDDDMPDEALVRYFRLETMYRASKTRAEFLNERRALKDHIV